MSDLKIINTLENDAEGYAVDVDGQLYYFSADDLESQLYKYIKIRERLKMEKRLRKEHEQLKDAYQAYLAILALVK